MNQWYQKHKRSLLGKRWITYVSWSRQYLRWLQCSPLFAACNAGEGISQTFSFSKTNLQTHCSPHSSHQLVAAILSHSTLPSDAKLFCSWGQSGEKWQPPITSCHFFNVKCPFEGCYPIKWGHSASISVEIKWLPPDGNFRRCTVQHSWWKPCFLQNNQNR